MAADGILAIWHDCVPGRETDFEAWYQTEHLIERLSVPGFLFGRRHEAVAGTPRYFCFYVTETPAVLTSAAYLARLNDPTPLTRTMMTEVFQNMNRTICRRAARVGQFRGAAAVTLRFDAPPDRSVLLPQLEALARDPAVASAELWLAVDDPAAAAPAQEERLRGGDRKIGGCVIVDTLRQDDAEALASRLAPGFSGTAEIGIYRVLCEIGRGDL